MAMIETAEIVAERYGISREAQDRYAAKSQQRAAAALAAGRFAEEIAPITVDKALFDKEGNRTGTETVTLTQDEGIRAGTTYRGAGGAQDRVEGRRRDRPRASTSPRATPASCPTARPRRS